jgi:hypothetical protein
VIFIDIYFFRDSSQIYCLLNISNHRSQFIIDYLKDQLNIWQTIIGISIGHPKAVLEICHNPSIILEKYAFTQNSYVLTLEDISKSLSKSFNPQVY